MGLVVMKRRHGMNNTTRKWFRPASLLFGMALVFDFFGHYSNRQYESFMKGYQERRQRYLDRLNDADADRQNLAADWQRVENSLRTAIASVK